MIIIKLNYYYLWNNNKNESNLKNNKCKIKNNTIKI